MIDILNEVNSRGCDVKYCFDIGHLLTIDLPMHKENFNKESIPERPEDLLEDIPAELFYKVHLNDFWINRDPEGEGKGEPPFKFHPPLHRETGFLKKENLIRFAEILRSKGAELIIVETAVRDIEDLLNAKQIIADETAYLNEVLK
ncbi:MAG: hypothetical protein GX817_00380 [Elusimicrobia bacterium]|nr:hypothetical protein [Elusimicrobiota bacterium]